ncbi:MAG: DUF6152 family protein [Gammaproteobacteria bacterium]
MSFFAELRRRNVFKFGAAYAVVASRFAMKRIGRKFSAMLLVMAAPSLYGHHSVGPNFDLAQEIVLMGAVITEFKFVNPHVYLYVEVPGEKGAIADWRCEMAAASRLKRRGWTAETLVPGQTISIDGSPGRREENVCHVTTITREDGSILAEYAGRPTPAEASTALASDAVIRSRPAYLSNGQPNLRGPWVSTQPSLDMPEIEPTAAGEQAGAGLVRHFDSPVLRCQPTNILFDWIFERMTNDIYQDDDTITLQYGYLDIVRTIHLGRSEHPTTNSPSALGHSIGRWENDVLVVDTIGFERGVLDHVGRSAGFPMHSDQWHVVERYEVEANGRTLTRTYTFDDPLFMQGTYAGQDSASLTTEQYAPYDCEELSGKNNQRDADLGRQ